MVSLLTIAAIVGVISFGADAWPTRCLSPSPNFSPYNKFYRGPNNHCYALITTKLRWYQASRACRALDRDAYLAVIRTNSELDWISSRIRFAPGYKKRAKYWVGGLRYSGNWRWVDNGFVNMAQPKPWRTGEPNNNDSKMVIKRVGPNKWRFHNEPGNAKYRYICEISRFALGLPR